MAGQLISAEVAPTAPGDAGRVAKALQGLGFKVLHIGPTISIQAPQALWEQTFNVAFRHTTKTVLPETGRRVGYARADTAALSIPPELEGLVADVLFAEPPDLH